MHQALQKMITSTDIPEEVQIIIESDNCSVQYKSSKYFYHLQSLANQLQRIIIRLYGIAMHGKGEVDHVGGVAKVAVRAEIAAGEVFNLSSQIVAFLQNKFGAKESPAYHIVEIKESALKEERDADRRITFKTIEGSSSFHVMVFSPNATTFKAAPRLCLCDHCKLDYGSCTLFKSYELKIKELAPTSLRSNVSAATETVGEEVVNEFIMPGTFVAVPAPKQHQDMVWFIKVCKVNLCDTENESTDGYHHVIPRGVTHHSGDFLERDEKLSTLKATHYKLSGLKTYFFNENVLYPHVNIQENDKGLCLDMHDYTDILFYIENSGFVHL